MEQVKGVEPSYQAWEACVLPMNYTCGNFVYYSTAPGKMQEKSLRLFCSFGGTGEPIRAAGHRMGYQAPEPLGVRQRWPRVFCLPAL